MGAGGSGSGAGAGGDEEGAGVLGGGGAEGGGGAVCAAQAVAFDEIRRREVRDGASLALEGVATSQKFLLSHAKSGSCLWAAFVGDEPDGNEPRGLLVASFGEEAPAESSCPVGTDGIPDALAPGDSVRVVGRLSEYVPSSCAGVAAEPQVLVDAACPIRRAGRREVPEPVTLSFSVADGLAAGESAELAARHAGGLVALEEVSGVRADDGEGIVAPYGVIRFAETKLEAHNDIAYADLSGAGPGDAGKSLIFPYPTKFSRMVGLIHLDFCTWSLALRDPCADVAPSSGGCD